MRVMRKSLRLIDSDLEIRVRRDLAFLFEEYGAAVTANTVEPFGNSEVMVETRSLVLRFAINERDADYRVLVAPRDGHGVWELLHVALAAATGEDPTSLITPFAYSDSPSAPNYLGLTRVAAVLRSRFERLDRAFMPGNYPATRSRMVHIERKLHPR